MVIPHNVVLPHDETTKDLSLKDGLASDELDGEVTAHHGDDQ